MFEQTSKNIDDILHKDSGFTNELEYSEDARVEVPKRLAYGLADLGSLDQIRDSVIGFQQYFQKQPG